MNRVIRKILEKAAATKFVQRAMADKADLRAFREKPAPRTIMGISAIGISYIIGWPAVALLGAVSVYLNKPMIALVGGPLIYGLSHLLFILGMYLAGAAYTKVFLLWATKTAMEKLMEKM